MKCLRNLLVSALVTLSLSCGGSTSGTGGTRIEGLVVDPAQSPLIAVIVTLLQTGGSATTGTDGRFVLTGEVQGDLQFEFVRGASRSVATVPGVEAGLAVLELTFEVDEVRESARPTEIKKHNASTDGASGSSGSSGGDDDDDDDDDSINSGPGGGGDHGSDDDGHDDDDDDDNDDSSSGGSKGPGSGILDPDGDKGDDSDDSDDSEEVRVEGTITAISATSITVNSTTFSLTAETEFRGLHGNSATASDFNVGDLVEVRGYSSGGSLIAERVDLED